MARPRTGGTSIPLETANDNETGCARRLGGLGAFSLSPRGLQREVAARYVGISPTKFDQLVADRRMPQPKRIDGRKVWDRLSLDAAFEALPSEEEHNPWDEDVGV